MADAVLQPDAWPEWSLPAAEGAVVKARYGEARVILEYGSGGSTWLAASMPGKLVFSVESDRAWAVRLQARLDALALPSPAIVHHVDIGPTGAWGRPLTSREWRRFHLYPLSIWDEPFFRHPDVVLIDGRFRAACMVSVLARIRRPVTVLFDDYVDRKPYHSVERFLRPVARHGRMVEFAARPGLLSLDDLPDVIAAFSFATYEKQKDPYAHTARDAILGPSREP